MKGRSNVFYVTDLILCGLALLFTCKYIGVYHRQTFLEDELGMTEIQGGFFVKGIRIPIPTFYITKLPITTEIWRAVMGDDKPRCRVEWYEYVNSPENLHISLVLNSSFQAMIIWIMRLKKTRN